KIVIQALKFPPGARSRIVPPQKSFEFQNQIPDAVDDDLVAGGEIHVLQTDDSFLRRRVTLSGRRVPVRVHPADRAVGVETAIEKIEQAQHLRRGAQEERVRRQMMEGLY